MTAPATQGRTLHALRRLVPRDPAERFRTASPLELFFDLVFVVAVSAAATQLHALVVDGRVLDGVLGYVMVYFGIWWAWMNFTWFASSYDNDDWLYRITSLVQMAGALVLAAGTEPAMIHSDYLIVTVGYVIMRLPIIGQQIRAALSHPASRGPALRSAAGNALVQVGWVLRLIVPAPLQLPVFVLLVAADISVPLLVEPGGARPWHARHIAERYGLFTLIILGDSILASTEAVVGSLRSGEHAADLLLVAACGFSVAAGLWWVYFSHEHHPHIRTIRGSRVFGYGHFVLFAAAGALSAGLEIDIDTFDAADTAQTGAALFSAAVAIFMVGLWALTSRHSMTRAASRIYFAGVAIVAVGAALPWRVALVLATAGVVLGVVATELQDTRPDPSLEDEAATG